METKRLPFNKSKLSMEFASMELEDASLRDREGALVTISTNMGVAPVWLQPVKNKLTSWLRACFSWLSADFRPAGPRMVAQPPAPGQGSVSRDAVHLFVSKSQTAGRENFRRIDFLPKKNPEEAFIRDPVPRQSCLQPLRETLLFNRQAQLPASWQEAEELTKTGFWECQMPVGIFHCTGNALKLVHHPQQQQQITFHSLISAFSQEDKNSLSESWTQLLTQARDIDYTACLKDTYGDKWIKIKAKAIWENSTFIKITGCFQDVTEAKALEQSLRQARDTAEAEMKAKSDFVSVITHEIRTPLNAISGFAYLLLQEEVSREEQKDYLRSIQFSTQNLLTLINETLDYSKIEAGKVEFEHIHFQFHELLEDIYRSFYLRAAEKKVNLYLDIHPETPDIAVGDPTKLCQILNNLISNAVKFTHEGHIKISVEVVYESETDWVVEFAVSDTGVGIALEKQPLIFESFTQANASTNRQFGGTGLGLAITKKLVELQQGSIQLNSTPGEGSEFIVRLKLAKPDPAQLAIHRPDLPLNLNQYVGLQGARILVVDDNALNRNVASKLLTNWQVKVDTAENGLEACKKVQLAPYDIILMDLYMPVMDGFEAIAQIKHYGIKTPIIALTGSKLTEEENKMMDLGVHDYVTKPFNPQELYKTILEHLILIEI